MNKELDKSTCIQCPFYEPPNKCQLAVGNPAPSVKSAREHYRAYFKSPCERYRGEVPKSDSGLFHGI